MRKSTHILAQARSAQKAGAIALNNALLEANSKQACRRRALVHNAARYKVNWNFKAEASLWLGKVKFGNVVMTEAERNVRNRQLRKKFIAKGCQGEMSEWRFSPEDRRRLKCEQEIAAEGITEAEILAFRKYSAELAKGKKK